MKRNYKLYLEDILESIESIETYIDGIDFEKFETTPLVIDAVLRRLTIIGEAANHLPKDLQKAIEIPWEKVIGMRNLLVHGYFDTNLKVTWKIATERIQELKKEIKKYLKSKA